MLIIMLTSCSGAVAGVRHFCGPRYQERPERHRRKVSVLALAVGNNCSATIEFNDPTTAEDTLSALRAEPSIVFACVYTRKGEPFAVYNRRGMAPIQAPPIAPPAECEFKGNFLRLSQPIVQRDQTVGTIYVMSDLTDLNERLARYPLTVGEMLLAALVVAFILSTRLHRVISNPILHLAEVASSVAADKNYSLRAKKQTEDELGHLIDVFNEMLGQIQQRDGQLQAARDLLEQRVKERTEELRQSQALYHSLIEHLPVHVYRKDDEGRFVFVNSHFCQFNGLREDQILGKSIADIFSSHDLCERHAKEDRAIMESGESIEREEEYAAPDGKKSNTCKRSNRQCSGRTRK